MNNVVFLTEGDLDKISEYESAICVIRYYNKYYNSPDTFSYMIRSERITTGGTGHFPAWEIDRSDIGKEMAYFVSDGHSQICAKKPEFLDYLRENYPKDLELILWHQEIFDGEFHEEE